jgi:hypothetical protein
MFDILKTIVVSLIVIVIAHYVWNYIKDTYSEKKTKDLVGSQTEKYKSMLNELIESKKENPTLFDNDDTDLFNMDDELTSHLEKELNTNNSIHRETTVEQYNI